MTIDEVMARVEAEVARVVPNPNPGSTGEALLLLDAEVRRLRAANVAFRVNAETFSGALALAEAKLARVEAAAEECISSFRLWTSQELYGEYIRDGMTPSDFEAWEESMFSLSVALKDEP